MEWMGENGELVQHQALQGDEWKGCFNTALAIIESSINWIILPRN